MIKSATMFKLYFVVTSIFLVSSANAYSPKTDEDYLMYLKEKLWPQAYKEQNVKLLDNILDPSFELVGMDGSRRNKQQELADLEKYAWPHESFSFTVSRLDIYQERFAVVSGQGKAMGKNEKGSYCFTYQSSNVLRKEKNTWRAVLSHVSGFKEEC